MYSLEFYIDYLGNVKKNITRRVVTDTTLLGACEDFIDAQVSWAKSTHKIGCKIAKHSADAITKIWFPQDNTDTDKGEK